MPRRRVHAGIILVGFVIASGLAMACLIFAALSVGGHHARTTDASATTTSAPPVTHTTVPKTSSLTPKTTSSKTASSKTSAVPPLAAASSAAPTPTPTTPGAINKGANQQDAGLQVDPGDCVGAIGSGAALTKASCGSANSVYKINSKAGPVGGCPSDSDRSVSQTLPGGAKNTLCLDTDWEVGRCMSVSGTSATPVDCSAATPGTVRVQAINRGTADVNTCTDANHGVVYKQRQFVVCVAKM